MDLNKLEQEIENELKEDEIVLLGELAEELGAMKPVERYKTGIYPIDRVYKMNHEETGGIAAGDLFIVAAPPSHGKTTMASTITQQLVEGGTKCLFFSYEVNIQALWYSFIAMGAKKEDIICTPFRNTTGNVEWVHDKIKEAKEKYDIKIVVIDHLGYLTPKMTVSSAQNYSIYLTQIVRELKTLAVEEGVGIILPVHVNKSTSSDPEMRDISHSGGIAQEADFVILMARQDGNSGESTYAPYTKVKVTKNRPCGETPIFFVSMYNGRLIEDVPALEQYKEQTNNTKEKKYAI